MADKKANKSNSKEAPAKKAEPKKEASKPTSGKVVKEGDKVKVEYVGTFTDGKIFDSSVKHGKPIEFVVGSGQVIKGFETAVLGKKVGDEVIVKILPADGYGERREDLVKIITRDKLPPKPDPKPGHRILLGLSNGAELPAFITKVNGDMVTIDLNHPLAGRNLNFKIKVIEF